MFRNIVMFPSRLGQPLYGVEQTPKLLRLFLNKDNRFYNIKSTKRLDQNLFNLYSQLHNMDEKRIVLGGDHSMSIATVADSLNRNPKTKVLWIDAHADLNTPASHVYATQRTWFATRSPSRKNWTEKSRFENVVFRPTNCAAKERRLETIVPRFE